MVKYICFQWDFIIMKRLLIGSLIPVFLIVK
jgi:hypothetical protein